MTIVPIVCLHRHQHSSGYSSWLLATVN